MTAAKKGKSPQQKLQEVQDRIEKEEKVRVKFINNETPGVPLEFTYEGIRYNLVPGQEYDLPYSVVNHLNSLAVPDPKFEIDPATQQLKEVSRTMKHRFTCHPTQLFGPKQEHIEKKAAAGA